MPNPFAGEVEIVIDGTPHICKLTLGAIAELETTMQVGSIIEIVKRFESGNLSSRDVLAVVVAGMRGGGWAGRSEDLLTAEIEGGALGAAQVAALLIQRAFASPT